MIWVTGDCHGEFKKFSSNRFPEGRKATKDDYVIICGDFGFWHDTPEEKYWLKWLDKKPWTTLFVDGNHENFDRLDALPVEKWSGGMIHRIKPSIIHLMRGQVFNLQGKKFFTFGGASSHDIEDGIIDPDITENWEEKLRQFIREGKRFRVNHMSWWYHELPTDEEFDEGASNLRKHGNEVDFIITHCAPNSVAAQLGFHEDDYLTDYLEEVKDNINYSHWYFGHYHDDINFNHEKMTLLYTKIERIL